MLVQLKKLEKFYLIKLFQKNLVETWKKEYDIENYILANLGKPKDAKLKGLNFKKICQPVAEELIFFDFI